MQIEQLIRGNLLRIGAVRAEVNRDGVATHWRTEKEADKAMGEFIAMGLLFVEKHRDNGLFAVFGKFNLPAKAPTPAAQWPGRN